MNSLYYFLTVLIICFSFCGCNTSEHTPPNVVIIFTDDQGYHDLSCYGATTFSTPHIDKLADEGVRFTSFYSTQAVCSASRAGLLTGCYSNRLEIHNAFMPKSKKGLNPEESTIASLLNDKGYRTAIYGKWHLGDHPDFYPMNYGFDEFFGILYSNDMWPYHPQQGPVFNFSDIFLYDQYEIIDTLHDQSNLTTQITGYAVDFIGNNSENPFFLYVAHPQPHVPLFVSDKFNGSTERGLYGDVIKEIDWSTGEIVKALKEKGIYDNTIIIFTSDNGPWLSYGDHSGSAYPLREGKGTALEGGQRVPCVVSYPDRINEAQIINDPAMGIDILPTIMEWTGAPLPEMKIDGRSLVPIIENQETTIPPSPYFFYYRVNELHGVRYDNWKMYFPHRYRSMNGRAGGKGGLPEPYDMNTMDSIELYDLSKDVEERFNVVKAHPEVVKRISIMADSIRRELGDALTGMEGSGVRKAAYREW